MKSHVMSHPCRLKPARFRRLDCRKRRIVVGGLKYEPLDALIIALPRASPPPPPISGAGAGAGAAVAAPGLQRRGGGGAARGPSTPRPRRRRRRCNVIRWNACAVGWDGDTVGLSASIIPHIPSFAGFHQSLQRGLEIIMGRSSASLPCMAKNGRLVS